MKKFYWDFAKNPEPMTAYDWVMVAAYFAVTLAFLIYHTEVAIWVVLFIYLRDRVHGND